MTQGRRSAARRGRSPLVALALHLAGALVALGAWAALAWAAIEFGSAARTGRTVAWVFTVAAGLGAAVCLVLVLALVSRVLVRLGLVSRAPGRRVRR
jgi:hypothetical protein